MLTALKVRLYPNKKQQIALAKNFGCCRFVWNFYLNKTNTQYQEIGKGLNYCDMAKDLTQLKKHENFLWLKEASSSALQQSLKNLETAFKNFFEHRAGFPKFKSKHKKQSLRYPAGCSIKKHGVQLPKLGIVKAVISKELMGEIKSVTVSKDSTDKYFAAILLEVEDVPTIKEGKISGVDLGLNSLVTVFDGETTYKVDPIKPTRKYAKRLRRRQQSLFRKKLGSNNRKKQVKRVAKVHHKIANTRQDFLHKISRKLVDENQVIVVEDLCVKGVARTKLAKSVLDAGFGMLVNFLASKLKRVGGILVEVDRLFPSTKLCNCCKFKNDSLTLNDREWVCPKCETHHDRDENAARNLREEGIRILSTNTDGQSEFQACGEDVSLVSNSAKKLSSMKQESPR
ncbi:RNA-guided endonuclease InsQ/TnpB family protein [Aerosakkonema funiforme]|uniref:IS200/IS605 family element transposase accessory protein TnpB n=1 Tax=Aerosakkonema funiforme FACHB-1375 TaxID=2949571 RepID=A0A926VEW4_9CYAN|nr:RNA-guided endonuclease TnpB family protein [Aerosakkonema funiforme]MBD2181707.1 IS200/IS605 family element transposase accessory protein TnpB [Aerosakkonema funiforme FACHB-1375]